MKKSPIWGIDKYIFMLYICTRYCINPLGVNIMKKKQLTDKNGINTSEKKVYLSDFGK
jgi:hypothetical protein